MPRRFLWMITIFLCSLFALATRDSSAAAKFLPFRQGERRRTPAMWGVIPAGEAIIEVLPTATIDGVKARHFAMTTTTNSEVDTL